VQLVIIKYHDNEFPLRKVIGSDKKLAIAFYLLGIGFTFLNT
jgi:hypothetical protein